MKKLYAESIINNRIVRPRPEPDECETVWELTEISPNRYKISVWGGANKQVMGKTSVKVAESGIAEINSDGDLVVIKKPKIKPIGQPDRKKQQTQKLYAESIIIRNMVRMNMLAYGIES